jgi:hypothetical protein
LVGLPEIREHALSKQIGRKRDGIGTANQRTRHRIRDVVVPAWPVVNAVPPAASGAALEADELLAEGFVVAEFGAEFRSDVEAFVTQEAVDACVIPGRFELPPVPGTRYIAFTDPSGGSGTDAMTLAVAHAGGEGAVLDLIPRVRSAACARGRSSTRPEFSMGNMF